MWPGSARRARRLVTTAAGRLTRPVPSSWSWRGLSRAGRSRRFTGRHGRAGQLAADPVPARRTTHVVPRRASLAMKHLLNAALRVIAAASTLAAHDLFLEPFSW